jgi:membrane-bound lytic murein transglycosylase D
MPLLKSFVLVVLCALFTQGVQAEETFVKSPALSDQVVPQPAPAAQPLQPAQDTAKPDSLPASPAPGISAVLNSAPSIDLWERVRDGFALQEMDGPLVRAHEAWFAHRPDSLKRTVERSKRYMFHIVEAVEKRGMPTEIALLPFIESAYNPKALSPAHASGIWQFIPSTGKNYGLEQNWWYDGRRDVLAATDAALDYLKKLHDQFGSWELALAAYNCGENCVDRAIARNRAKGEATDYQNLRLPLETRQYVPKLIAIRNIISNPTAFGLALADIPNKPYFTTVTLNRHIDSKLAAKLAEIPLDEFVALNPAYNRPVVSATTPRSLLLPVDKVDEFNANLESNLRPLVSWQSYAAKRGEKLNGIAQRFGTSTSWLKANNHIPLKRNKMTANQLLLVPLRDGKKADITQEPTDIAVPTAESEDTATGKTSYVVRKGDTVLSVAKRNHMQPRFLKVLNGLKSNRLAVGRKLIIESRTAAKKKSVATRVARAKSPSTAKHKLYTVRRGDTLSSIAHRYKVATNDIQRWNNLGSHRSLMPGAKVKLVAGVD